MDLHNHLSSSDSDVLPEELKEKAKQERNKVYKKHTDALNNNWKKMKDDCRKERHDTVTEKTKKKKLEKTSSDVVKQVNDVLNSKRIQMNSYQSEMPGRKVKSFLNQEPELEPPCALCRTFSKNFKYQKGPIKLTIESDHLSKENRLCKYLKDNYPDSNKYVYHFPVSYNFKTERSDNQNIRGKLSCCCLSHYSDEILNEMLEQARERGDDLLQEQREKDPERKKGRGDPENSALNVQQLAKNVKEYLQRRNAFKAVQNVCQQIELWSRRESAIHMFIMANVNYKTYLKGYNRHKPVTENRGDHDIMLIIREVGIVFIQVKSCTTVSNDSQQIKKAFQQVLRDQFVFLESNRDLDFISPTFPIWGFIALPNTSIYTLPQGGLCDVHKEVVLCKEDLEHMTRLSKILQESKSQESKNKITWTNEEFRYVCARYVGEGKPKGMQNLSDSIERVIKMFGKTIFTPKQNKILENESPCQVIKGEFGSGKTLLMCKKAYDISRKTGHTTQKTNDPTQKTSDTTQKTDVPTLMTDHPSQKTDDPTREKIYLITCVGLDKDCLLNTTLCHFPVIEQMEKYLKDIKEQQEKSSPQEILTEKEKDKIETKIEIITLGNLVKKYKVLEEPCQHNIKVTSDKFNTIISKLMLESKNIFIDEMPLNLFNDLESYLLSKMEDYKGYEGYHVWISIATQSCYGVLNPKNECSDANVKSKLFQSHFLEENMRNSCAIVRMMKFICNYTGETLMDNPNIGHCVEGPIPLLCRIPYCLCSDKVNRETIFCECLEGRIQGTLKFVHKVLGCTNKSNIDVVYMISHFYNDAFKSSIFDELKKVFDKVFVGIDRHRHYSWLTLAETKTAEHDIEVTNSDTTQITHSVGTTLGQCITNYCQRLPTLAQRVANTVCCQGKKIRSETQKAKSDPQTKTSDGNTADSDKEMTNSDATPTVFDSKTAESETQTAKLDSRMKESDAEATVSDSQAIDSDKKTAEFETPTAKLGNKAAEYDAETAKYDTKTNKSNTKTVESDTWTTKTKATVSDSQAIDSDKKTAEFETPTAKLDTKAAESDTWTTKTELIIDEATFAGCESSIVIYIDLLSMWQLLPAETNEGNGQQRNKKTKVGAGSILIPSRCTSQYVHITLQREDPKIFINEHIRMFEIQRDSSKDIEMQNMCNKAIELMRECLQNQGKLLEKLLNDGIMREINFPPKPDDDKHEY